MWLSGNALSNPLKIYKIFIEINNDKSINSTNKIENIGCSGGY
jgi:hypothetical protein